MREAALMELLARGTGHMYMAAGTLHWPQAGCSYVRIEQHKPLIAALFGACRRCVGCVGVYRMRG